MATEADLIAVQSATGSSNKIRSAKGDSYRHVLPAFLVVLHLPPTPFFTIQRGASCKMRKEVARSWHVSFGIV